MKKEKTSLNVKDEEIGFHNHQNEEKILTHN